MPEPVQVMWVGPRLGVIERISIGSFLDNGHKVILYVYGPVEGVPAPVEVRRADEIVPYSAVNRWKHMGVFADYWRSVLMNKLGGWWVDLDAICLRPFDFPDKEFVIGQCEHPGQLASGIIRFPMGHPVVKRWNEVAEKAPYDVYWGHIGPRLLTDTIIELGLLEEALPGRVFYPLLYSPPELKRLFLSSCSDIEGSHSVHFWGNILRRSGIPYETGRFRRTCLFERLKQKHLHYTTKVAAPP